MHSSFHNFVRSEQRIRATPPVVSETKAVRRPERNSLMEKKNLTTHHTTLREILKTIVKCFKGRYYKLIGSHDITEEIWKIFGKKIQTRES